jgi:hypothetical protein
VKVRTNLVGGGVFIVFGTILLACLNNQIITCGNITFLQSAKVLPFVAEIVMIFGGILLVIESTVFKKDTIVEFVWEEQKNAIYTIGFFCIFAVGIYFLGFVIGGILFMISMFLFYKNKSILQFICLVLLVIGIYYLFTRVFYVQLPGLGGMK